MTRETDKGKCWKRGDCVPTRFESSSAFNTYVNVSRDPLPAPPPAPPGFVGLSFGIEQGGFGCVIESLGAPSAALSEHLAAMAKMTSKPLASCAPPRATTGNPSLTCFGLGSKHVSHGAPRCTVGTIEISCDLEE